MTTFTASDTAVFTIHTEGSITVFGNGAVGQTQTILGPRSDSDYFQGQLFVNLHSTTDQLLFGGTVFMTGPTAGFVVVPLNGTGHNHTVTIKTGITTLSQGQLGYAVTYFKN